MTDVEKFALMRSLATEFGLPVHGGIKTETEGPRAGQKFAYIEIRLPVR